MVNISQEFATESKYLRSADLGGRVARVTIAHVNREQVGSDTKLVCYFRGKQKGMVLNRTNARTIADTAGDETDNWTGMEIEIFSMKVPFERKMVDGLRVRVLSPPRRPAPNPNGQAWADGEPAAPGYDTGRTRVTSGRSEPNPPAPAPAGGGAPFDDSIPFAPETR